MPPKSKSKIKLGLSATPTAPAGPWSSAAALHTHTVFMGTTGSGKSMLLSQLLWQQMSQTRQQQRREALSVPKSVWAALALGEEKPREPE